MEKLQANIAQAVLRASVWAGKAALWLVTHLTALGEALQRIVTKIPLTTLQWILLVYVLLGVIYAFASPVLEVSDELEHVAVIASVREGALPVIGATGFWQEQAAQPPAYYAAAALVTLPFDLSELNRSVERNPYADVNNPYGLGNKNLLLPPVTGWSSSFVTAVVVLRLLNVLLGLVTIAAIWRIALALSPRRPSVALMAAALAAFNPMFIFISASVGNLPLAMAFNALIVLLTMNVLRTGGSTRLALIGAALVAGAAAVHLSGLLVGLVLLCVAAYVARRDHAWQPFGLLLAVTLVGVGVVLGAWFVRNITLYGDPLAFGAWRDLVSRQPEGTGAEGLLSEFAHFRRSFWGVFGVGTVALGDFAYTLLDALTFIALFGVAYMVMQLYAIRDFAHARRELVTTIALLGSVLLGMVAYFVWQGQERLVSGTSLFPFMGAIAPLLAAGFIEMVWWLLFFVIPPDRSYVRAGDAVPNETLRPNSVWSARFLMIMALFTPLLIIAPTYTAPAPLTDVPADAVGVYARYDDVELIAYRARIERYLPGELVPVTLYWRVIQPTATDWTVSLALVPPFGGDLGKLDTYPGWGKLRTSTWQAGEIYADTYFVRLNPLVAGNFPLKLHVVWWDDADGRAVAIVDANDAPLSSVLLDMGVLTYSRNLSSAFASLDSIEPRRREFGGEFRLQQFTFDRHTYQTILVWEALRPTDIDYTMSVQLLNERNEIVGQLDTPPTLPTTFWEYGERYFTDHAIVTDGPLQPGTYRLIATIYNLSDGTRLLVQDDPEDDTDPTNYVQLFSFTIAEDGQFVSEELDKLEPEVTAVPEVTAEVTAEATTVPESTAEATADALENGTLQPEGAPLAPTAGG